MRKFDCVLEHSNRSSLWPHCGLPAVGERDKFGGWTPPIFQSSFGHRAEKATLLYIVGCAPTQIPAMPIVLGEALHVIAQSGRNRAGERRRKDDPGWRSECSKAEREHTPVELAHWLVASLTLHGASMPVHGGKAFPLATHKTLGEPVLICCQWNKQNGERMITGDNDRII